MAQKWWGFMSSSHPSSLSSSTFPWLVTFLGGAAVATSGWVLASYHTTKWVNPFRFFSRLYLTHSLDPKEPFNNLTPPPNCVIARSEEPITEEESQSLNLLYSIAEEQAKKEGYVHRGITCNHCGASPIRGLRFKCCHCADFDLCENCESQDVHLPTHLFLKIRIPIPPLANPRSALLTVYYPGNPNSHDRLSWDIIRELQQQTHFDHIELEALYEEYKSLAPSDQGITKMIFEQCLGPLGQEKNLIAERIFHFFDSNSDGMIDFHELVKGLSVLCKGNLDEKASYAFQGYDLNGDGKISQDELHAMFKAYFHLSMELVRDIVKALEEEMMDSFDDENNKPVSAVFTAPIPNTSSSSTTTTSATTTSGSSSSTTTPVPRSPHPSSSDSSSSTSTPSSTTTTSNSNSNPDEIPENLEPAIDPSMDSYPLVPTDSMVPSQEQPPVSTHRYKPIMEQMSQDAIAEMVEKTFKSMDVDQKGYIEFPEFKAYVENDSTLISWFETLGSVF